MQGFLGAKPIIQIKSGFMQLVHVLKYRLAEGDTCTYIIQG